MFRWRRESREKLCSAIDCLRALADEDPGKCRLREGLDSGQIAEISDITGTRVPEDLSQLLLFTNGASLYGGACAIFGRHIGTSPYDIGDICQSTIWYRENGALGRDELVFGQRSGGGLFVLLSDREKRVSEFRVWYPGEDQVEDVFRSLAAWLSAELEFWREVGDL